MDRTEELVKAHLLLEEYRFRRELAEHFGETTPKPEAPTEVLTAIEAMKLLKLKKSTFYRRLAAANVKPLKKMLPSKRYRRSDIEKLVK